MLSKCGIISSDDSEKIGDGLLGIKKDIESGVLQFNPEAEDIHMFIEEELTKRIGDAGKRLHTCLLYTSTKQIKHYFVNRKQNRIGFFLQSCGICALSAAYFPAYQYCFSHFSVLRTPFI